MAAELRGPTVAPYARILRGVAGLAVFATIAEVASRAGLAPATSLPPASSIIARLVALLADPEFLAHVGGTLLAWALGLGLATVVAVPFGILLGWSRHTYLAATAAVELLRPIPSVALIPLAILLLGRGLDMKVALAAYAALWPILINTTTGVRMVDPVAIDTARVYGLSGSALVRRVVLPSAAPFAFTGVRISSAIALIVVVSAELVAGGGRGIGTWMLGVSQAGVPRELLYAGIVVTGLIGLLVNGIMVAGERRLFAWHQRVREAS